MEHLPGIEPGPNPWQGFILPLNHRCDYAVAFAFAGGHFRGSADLDVHRRNPEGHDLSGIYLFDRQGWAAFFRLHMEHVAQGQR